jgi:hypothetical protein
MCIRCTCTKGACACVQYVHVPVWACTNYQVCVVSCRISHARHTRNTHTTEPDRNSGQTETETDRLSRGGEEGKGGERKRGRGGLRERERENRRTTNTRAGTPRQMTHAHTAHDCMKDHGVKCIQTRTRACMWRIKQSAYAGMGTSCACSPGTDMGNETDGLDLRAEKAMTSAARVLDRIMAHRHVCVCEMLGHAHGQLKTLVMYST